jgi:hypothetical protein
MIFVGVFPAAAEEVQVEVQAIPADQLMFDAITNFSGVTSNINTNPNNICFNASSATTFRWGDTIAFSVLWSDTVSSSNPSYGFILAVRPSTTGSIIRLVDDRCNFSGLNPGTPYNLCCWVPLTLPLPSPPPTISIDWGAKVDISGSTGVGLLGNFTIR